MKTVQFTVIILVLLATLMMAGPALAAPGVTLTTPATTVQVGDEFTVTVGLTGVDQVWGVGLFISYDYQKLDGLNSQPGFEMVNAFQEFKIANGKVEITVAALGGTVISLAGADNGFALLKFEAKAPGNTLLKIDQIEVVLPLTADIPETISLGSAELQLEVQGDSDSSENVENTTDITGNAGNTSNNGDDTPGNANLGSGSGSNPGNSATAPGKGNQPAAKESSQRPQGQSPVDVAPGHWARSSIQQLVDGGYASGYEDGSFKPEQEITRAEFLALVTRILGLAGATTAVDVTNAFSDGSAIPAWAQGVVASAYARGLVQGDEQGRFRPNAPISRAEIAAIVIRALDEEEQSKAVGSGQQAFTDSTQASWAAGYLGRGKQLGLMTGYEDGTFRPNNRSTRAEAAALVSRMLGRLQPGNRQVAS